MARTLPKTKAPSANSKAGLWEKTFLDEYRRHGIVLAACQTAGIHRDTFYAKKKSDPDFARKFKACHEEAADIYEAQLYKLIMHPTKPNPILLMFKLKSMRPKLYRDNFRVEATGADGAPLLPPVMLLPQLKHGRQ
jgi:hypothetical protein